LKDKLTNNPDFIPTEPAPTGEALGNSVALYGFNTFDKFFSDRQKLTLGIFAEKIRELHSELVDLDYDKDHAKTIVLLLGFVLDRFAMLNNQFNFWYQKGELIKTGLTVGQFRISWEFIEPNPFNNGSGSWTSCLSTVTAGISVAGALPLNGSIYQDRIGSATNLPYKDATFDIIATDPPYYDYIPYADVSDFFFVWLKRTVGKLFPEVFQHDLTPKEGELIYSSKPETTRSKLEEGLAETWKECHRVLKDEGLLVVQFANRSVNAWKQIAETLMGAGFDPVVLWPILSESPSKLSAHRAT
ncbi:MAG TPA: hypothetical protein VJ044_01050, partial [Candidatus Hodarchaeales archaeon]|nr:hypothetical protein [Candidatus Hodarchaeales archaeon]